ncbi:MAG: ATP-binding protein, partial [Candidatus Hydrogenedentes bacterium]|nr:ATP-binding protein [Candidatus Hydrogenedentota bacterium]
YKVGWNGFTAYEWNDRTGRRSAMRRLSKYVLSLPIGVHLYLLVLFVLMPAVGTVIYTGFERHTDALRDAQVRALQVVTGLAVHQERTADGIRQILAILSHVPEFEQRKTAECNELLAELLKSNPQYASLQVAAPDGMVFASGIPVAPYTVADRKYFKDAVRAGVFSVGEYAISRSAHRPVLHFAYPAYDAQGVLRMVYLAGFDVTCYDSVIARGHMPPNSVLVLADHKGVVLHRYPEMMGAQGQPDLPAMMKQMVSSEEDEGVFRASGQDGVKRLYAFVRVRLTYGAPYMFIRVGIPESEALAEARIVLYRELGFLCAAVAIAMASAWLVGRRLILSPLKRLMTAVRAIEEGDLNARAGLAAGEGEFGHLAAAFNDMALALQERQMRLAETVASLRDREEFARTTAEALALRSRELEEAIEELRRRNRELDEFTYVSSHDLQEPLRQLVSFSALLRRDAGSSLSERALKDLEFITSCARRMQTLVQDLLALSRAGRAGMNRAVISLDRCVDRALDALQERIRETGATIARTHLPVVEGDELLLTQLYQNLIGNALKFAGGKAPAVCITVEETAGRCVLGVRDAGIGIAPQYAEQIFAPFKRLHARGEYEGSGIGLAICRRVVERHHGQIWVESELGSGAHFRFTLNEGS